HLRPNAQAQPRARRSKAEAWPSAGAPCWAWLRQQLIKRQSVAKRIPELKISNGFWNSFNLVNIDTEARSKHPTCFDVVRLEAHYLLIWLIDFTFKKLQ